MTQPAVPEPAPTLAERVADAVRAYPGVAGLNAGMYGDIATYLAGRRLAGVRIGEAGEPVAIGVVVRFGQPIPPLVDGLRGLVSGMCDGAAVDITVADVLGDDTRPAVTG